jgi:hypothetical protein
MQYAVQYKSRNNTGIDRKQCISGIADLVGAVHKVDLENPDLVIIVEVFKACTLSVWLQLTPYSKVCVCAEYCQGFPQASSIQYPRDHQRKRGKERSDTVGCSKFVFVAIKKPNVHL